MDGIDAGCIELMYDRYGVHVGCMEEIKNGLNKGG